VRQDFLPGAVLLVAGWAGAAAAQSNLGGTNYGPANRPLLFAEGGGVGSLRAFEDDDGDAFDLDSDFAAGRHFGGGVGLQINRWTALRAVYASARATGEGGASSPLANNRFRRQYYGADIQLRGGGRLAPYFCLGAGAVTIRPESGARLVAPDGTAFGSESWTKPAGRFGVGFEVHLGSGLSLFADSTAWVYRWDRYGIGYTPVDVNWGGGLAYRFGY